MPHVYEHPLNERIRLFLRLEHVLKQMEHVQNAREMYAVQLFLDALFDSLDFLHRYEIRSEIIKELQFYRSYLNRQEEALTEAALLKRIDEILSQTHQLNINLISALRENELFNSLRQRNFNQSGNCIFEVPAYQYWLQRVAQQQNEFSMECYALFKPIAEAIDLILNLVRRCSESSEALAEEGIYLKTIDSKKRSQMLRIHLAEDLPVFPRISGDKHRFAIRFMRQEQPRERAMQVQDLPIPFTLQVCAV